MPSNAPLFILQVEQLFFQVEPARSPSGGDPLQFYFLRSNSGEIARFFHVNGAVALARIWLPATNADQKPSFGALRGIGPLLSSVL